MTPAARCCTIDIALADVEDSCGIDRRNAISTALTLWILNIAVDTGGQLAFKRAALIPVPADKSPLLRWTHSGRMPWIGAGVACYIVEFVAWLAFLSLVPLSQGVLLASINIVTLALAGRFAFAESLDGLRLAGIALIAGGVAIVGLDAF